MKTFLQQSGFTVMEILVVVIIISLLIAVTVTNFPAARDRVSLSEKAYQFEQTIRRAQSLALASVEYKDASGNAQAVDGYGVYINTDSPGDRQYLLYADKAPGNERYDSDDYVVDTISLSDSPIVILEFIGVIGNQVSINMRSATMATRINQLAPSSSAAGVVFSLVNNSEITKRVWVNTAGLSEVK